MEWLKVSNKSDPKCELCGTEFHFTKKYCDNAPERLSALEFIVGIFPRIGSVIATAGRGLTVFLCWVIFFPLWSWWTVHNTTHFLMGDVYRFNPFEMVTEWQHVTDPLVSWWHGSMVCVFILLSILGGIQLAAFIRDEVEQAAAESRNNDGDTDDATDNPLSQLDNESNDDVDRPRGADVNNIEEEVNVEGVVDGANNEEEVRHDDEAHTIQENIYQVEESEEERVVLEDEDTVEQALAQEEEDEEDEEEAARQRQALEAQWELENRQLQEENRRIFEQQQQQARPARQIPPMHFEDDELVVDIGSVLCAPIWKTLSEVIAAVIVVTSFIYCVLLMPVFLGRLIIYLLSSEEQVRGMGNGVMNWLENALLEQGTINNSSALEFLKPFSDNVTQNISEASDTIPLKAVMNARDIVIAKLVVGCEFVTGWVCIIVVLSICFVWWLSRKFDWAEGRRPHIGVSRTREKLSFFFSQVRKYTKSAIFVGFELTIIPQSLGWVIDVITLSAFDTSLKERLDFLQDKPLLGGLIHFMVGFAFSVHVSVFTSELRRILKENVLKRILPEQNAMGDDYAFDVVGEQSLLKLSQRSLLTLFHCIAAMLMMIMLPISIGHQFIPFATPLKLQFNELYYDIQLPLELLMFQFLLPFLARQVSHRQCIRLVMSMYMVHMCRALGLDDYLDEDVVATVLRRRGVEGVGGNGNENNEEVHVEEFVEVEEEVEEEEDVVIGNGVDRDAGVDAGGDEQQEEVHNFGDVGTRDNNNERLSVEQENTLEAEETSGTVQEQPSYIFAATSQSHHRRSRKINVIKMLKTLFLVIVGLFLLFLISSWCIYAPVIVGRSIFQYFG